MRPTKRPTSGFTLVEVVVATASLAILGLAVVNVGRDASEAIAVNATRFEAHHKARRAVDLACRYLRAASLSTLETIPEGFETWQPLAEGVAGDELAFRTTSYVDAPNELLPGLSAPFRLTIEDTPTDPPNGADDDNDGVIDGRQLVLQRPGLAAEPIARNVTQFAATLGGRTLTITASVAFRASPGVVVTETASKSVEIRND